MQQKPDPIGQYETHQFIYEAAGDRARARGQLPLPQTERQTDGRISWQ